MLRAPSAALFRAATKRWALASSPAAASAPLPSPKNNKMMLSTTSVSWDESDIIASHDRIASSSGDTIATNHTTSTKAAISTTTSIKNIVYNFIMSTSHNYVNAITIFIRGGDLTWSMTSSSAITSSSSSSLRRIMMEAQDEILKVEQTMDGKMEEGDVSWETTTESASLEKELAIWQISTLKRRKKMMNKHKLQKRRKKLRLKTRK